jgi:hypothetical protein
VDWYKRFPYRTVNISGDEICLRSVRTKVSSYGILKDPTQTKKRKRVHKVHDVAPSAPPEKSVLVDGGRVKGCCGAPYFSDNGSVFAFHTESIDDGEGVSETNSLTSDRSHTSFSSGIVLCRTSKFKEWYNVTGVSDSIDLQLI